jgi:hypothetical protein
MKIRKVQLICIGLGVSEITWAILFSRATFNAIAAVAWFVAAIAFGLLRGEL